MHIRLALKITELAEETLRRGFSSNKVGPFSSSDRIVYFIILINQARGAGHVSEAVLDFYTNPGKSGVGLIKISASAKFLKGGTIANGMLVGPLVIEPGL